MHALPRHHSLLPITTALLLLTACGGLDYDAEYDCAQTISCARSRGQEAPTLKVCVDVTEALVDNLSDAQGKKLEELYALCKSRTGCDYADCVEQSASLTASGIQRPTRTHRAGALAHSARFWRFDAAH